MKTGLVLEGGAMRGVYTAGVLDVFMDHDIGFDGVIGVSAGALFGINLLSKQKGRVIRYNKKFNGDKNYMGFRPLLKTGNIIDTQYAYYTVPAKLDVFDNETFMASKVPFYAVVTNLETGDAEYIRITDAFAQMETLRASASMPFVARPVEIDGRRYMDGAVADSIPFEKFLEMGYDRLVVVLTKDADYIKGPVSPFMTKAVYGKKYARFEKKLRERHSNYNSCVQRLNALEKEGGLFVIRPSARLKMSRIEKNPETLQKMYDLGVGDANARLDEVKNYLYQEGAAGL